ncbi:MAG: methyltransferase family protein [Daejeonella sp.]|uniref:methyltransferase family protein n=1 Tax=Daejeonella sp. JGW-45 TaxID=3034148 RepID=UPI0023EBDEEB|nr:isoprenylcysteine carboxylmethyltransferase family protein [Daejeonella sp. JGW-45]
MALIEQMESQGNWLFKHRGILPLIVFVVGALLFLQNESDPKYWTLEGTPYEMSYELSCLLVSLLGLVIRIYTVGFSADNTSGRNTERQVADVLNTKGIYSTMRNPLYVGNFFMWLGIAMLTGHFWFTFSFILFYFLYYERIIFTEEQFLRNKFGSTYLNWASKTPIIIPNFSSFVKPDNKFSWKKVLRQEKNGLAALFLIFCLFDISGELVKRNRDYNEGLLIAGALSVVIYLVLKYLKYNTSLLKENTY